ncbi:MAG: NAD(P)H-dependent oxidoreductase [Gammaproteobacteria bacterium]|nr:NAD(P)H-dependent oxidoreductase [Gammaproteobacteria bacterium]
MKNVLRITASILGEGSVSSQLMDELVTKLGAEEELKVTERNFMNQAIPHLDGPWLTALSTAEADRSDEQQAKVAFSDQLVAELQGADTVVISLPMYNFSLPSMLKAWVDHIARAGVTFKYTESGSVGLLKGKKVYLVAAMGGIHETSATDFLRPYMKHIMAFIGLNDVQFITADGLNVSQQRREQGLASARSEIADIVSNFSKEVAA